MDTDFLRELFAGFGIISLRRMFGGLGVFHDGLMFALVFDDAVFLKAAPGDTAAFAAEGCEPLTYESSGRTVALSYWQLPDRLYDDPDELARWAERAHRAALTAVAGKARAGKARPRRALEQFQEKCAAVFRPELRRNGEIERFAISRKR